MDFKTASPRMGTKKLDCNTGTVGDSEPKCRPHHYKCFPEVGTDCVSQGGHEGLLPDWTDKG